MWGKEEETTSKTYKNANTTKTNNYYDDIAEDDCSRGGDRETGKNYNKTKFTSRKLVAWQIPEDVKFSKKISERFDPSEMDDNQNIKIDYYRQPSKEASRDPRDYRSLPQVSKEFRPAMLEASSSEWIRGEPARHVLVDQISVKLGVKSDLNLYALLEETFQLTENDVININLHSGGGGGGLCASVLFTSGFKAWEIVRRSRKTAEWTMRIDSGAREFERIKEKDRDELNRREHRDANRREHRDADRREHRDADRREHTGASGRDDIQASRDIHNGRRDEPDNSKRLKLSCNPFVPCLRIPFSCDDSLPFRLTTEIVSSAFPSTRFPSFSGVEEGSSTWHVHFGREIDIVGADEMLQRDLFQWKGDEFYFERWNLMKGGQAWSIPDQYTVKKAARTAAMGVEPQQTGPSVPPVPRHALEPPGQAVDYLNLPKFTKKRTAAADFESDNQDRDRDHRDLDGSTTGGGGGGIKMKVKRKPIGKRIFVPPPMILPAAAVCEPAPPKLLLDDLEIDAVPLKSGSARTEGFFALDAEEKQRVHFKGFLEAFSSNSSGSSFSTSGDPGTAAASSTATTSSSMPTTESRSSRAQNRRPLPAAAMVDLFKVSPLQSTQKLVALRNSSIHSYGLVVMEAAEPGDLILEYVGELVRASVANIREWKYEREYTGDGIASSYLFRLDGIMVIDATHQGSLARFINHSCDPNCVAKTISLNASKRIVMYANKSIRPGDEITYDYKFPTEKDPKKKVKCLCGTGACRKFLN